jgi:hypothetical protein
MTGKLMKWVLRTLVPFFCGSVVVMNLSGLIEVNSEYDYQWWKVVVAGLIFFVVPLLEGDK